MKIEDVKVEKKIVKIGSVKRNTGQVEGLPKNPRVIRDEKYEMLKASIEEDPEMMVLRPLIIYKDIVIAGNQRLSACRDLGWKTIPCDILPDETPVKKLKAIAIKDNTHYGENDWDAIANEWSDDPLQDWGLFQVPHTNYNPEFTPEFANQDVSDEDIAKAQDDADNRHSGPYTQTTISVICPHCGEEYEINKPG